MRDKELALDSIRRMPDEASLKDILERVRFLAAVQEGLDAADRGEVVSHDEVKRQLANWLKE